MVKPFLRWLDRRLLFVLSIFLLAFIPLYPKIPLFDILPGYIVRVRIEDFLVLFTGLVWLRDVYRKKIPWNTSYLWIVCLYTFVGLVSIILGIVLLSTIPSQLLHIGKSSLTLFRYLEYFSLFFFLYSSVLTKKRLYIILITVALTLLGVVAYGLGQQYARFPVYSTMNREYSKGERLYLEQGARPQSTFGGHYDLAAYLVIVLPLLFSISLIRLQKKSVFVQIAWTGLFQLASLAGAGMLLLTSSKVSIVGCTTGMGIVILLHLYRLPTRKAKLLWGSLLITVGIIGFGTLWLTNPLRIRDRITNITQPKSPTATSLPSDLVGDGYETKDVTTVQPDGTIKHELVRVAQVWSPNALKYGLSMGIRLDALWPQALLGFARNPLSGAGYGTLAMLDTRGFIEADSTDNNFLRTLGETGLLGVIVFYGFILLLLFQILKFTRDGDPLTATLAIGFSSSIIGLLISAIYLDVFAASKVAFVFWALAGTVMRSIRRQDSLRFITLFKNHFFSHWPLYTILILAFFLLHQNPFLTHTPTKDIASSLRGLEQLTAARCFLTQGSFSLCRNSGLVLSPHVSIYALLLVPFLKIFPIFGVFSYLNFTLLLVSFFVAYKILARKISQITVFLVLSLYLLIASVFRLTQSPFAEIVFWLVFFSPLILILFTQKFMHRPRFHVLLRLGVGGLGLYTLVFGQLAVRFQNLAPNHASEAVEVVDGAIYPAEDGLPNYLITALNPYFVDLTSKDTYTLLPLSAKQPYSKTFAKVWGSKPSTAAHFYVSDYDATKDRKYSSSFEALKKSHDLHYLRIGCDELCNLYRVTPYTEPVSIAPISPFDNRMLSLSSLSSSYDFFVINNLFDPPLQDTTISYNTLIFTRRLASLVEKTAQFMVLTGDAINIPQKDYADILIQGFAKKVSYPLLYLKGGNPKIIPDKYFEGEFRSFFTKDTYFILLPVQYDSHIRDDNRLKLYDAFLELEKLPNIKSLVIIAHDLNWQDTRDIKNVVHAIRKKLAAFPNLHTTIITANHRQDLLTAKSWYDAKTTANLTFVSSLAAGNSRDVYVQVNVDHGKVTVKPLYIPWEKQ